MKNRSYLFVYVLVLFQFGCSLGKASKPSEFYVLSPETDASGKTLPASMSLGVGPITLPDLFDRPQIVTRPEANRIVISEFDRWGGNLQDDLRRILAHNLSVNLDTDAVKLFPWARINRPDLQVTVHFSRFDGELGKTAIIAGLWTLQDPGEGCELARHGFIISQPTNGESYVDYVGAISRAVGQLSQNIAAKVAVTKHGCPE